MLSNVLFDILMLTVIMLSAVILCVFILSDVMLSIKILTVAMLSDVLFSVDWNADSNYAEGYNFLPANITLPSR
jgi:hypothetical protein